MNSPHTHNLHRKARKPWTLVFAGNYEYVWVPAFQRTSGDELSQSAMNFRCISPEFILGFINVYREHICLWTVKGKSHSNTDMKEKACEQLLDYDKHYDSFHGNSSSGSRADTCGQTNRLTDGLTAGYHFSRRERFMAV